jgi:hypothetical protein
MGTSLNTTIELLLILGQVAMTISKNYINKIQKPIIYPFLTWMGYNQHTLQEIVYESKTVGD